MVSRRGDYVIEIFLVSCRAEGQRPSIFDGIVANEAAPVKVDGDARGGQRPIFLGDIA